MTAIVIRAVMPEGVEHTQKRVYMLENAESVIRAVMPEGVEHL